MKRLGSHAIWLSFFFLTAAFAQTPEAKLRTALAAKTGTVTLPAGVVEVSREIVIPPDAHDLTITAKGATLKASATFRGRALLILAGSRNIKIEGLTLDGNREKFVRPTGLAPADSTWTRFVANSGIIADGVSGLHLEGVSAANIAGLAILISGGRDIHIHQAVVTDSGGLNAAGHNNATGGILLEEGVTDFEVLDGRFGNVRGNAVWTRSLARSAKNTKGRIAGNEFAMIARSAIELGGATDVRVENNRGRGIGFAVEEVDTDSQTSAITAKDVTQSILRSNQFEEVDGKCFALESVHDSEISGNTCVNGDTLERYPFGNFAITLSASSQNVRIEGNTVDGALFGGALVSGSKNTVSGNHFLHLNMAHCNDPGPINCAAASAQPDRYAPVSYLAPLSRQYDHRQ